MCQEKLSCSWDQRTKIIAWSPICQRICFKFKMHQVLSRKMTNFRGLTLTFECLLFEYHSGRANVLVTVGEELLSPFSILKPVTFRLIHSYWHLGVFRVRFLVNVTLCFALQCEIRILVELSCGAIFVYVLCCREASKLLLNGPILLF